MNAQVCFVDPKGSSTGSKGIRKYIPVTATSNFISFLTKGIIFPNNLETSTGEWRKLHNEKLHDLYSSSTTLRVIKSRKMRWAGHVTRKGEGRGIHRVLVGKPEGKRPMGKPIRRWEDNIKMDLQVLGCEGMHWIELAQGRDRWWAFVNAVMNLRVQ
jgi:hypothetical protein